MRQSASTGSVPFERVAVIGLGYVGLPLLLAFRRAGLEVTGIDIDPQKPRMLAAGTSYLDHIPDQALEVLRSGHTVLGSDTEDASEADAVIIAVPTPLKGDTRQGSPEPDLSFIENTGRRLAPHLRPGQLISLESTTYPGTTREVLLPILERGSGLKGGKDFLLAFSPERVDPGSAHDITNIPKVVAGLDAASLERACALYEMIVPQTVPVSDLETGEMVKLLENIYRTVNIALVNELKLLSFHMGVDIWEVIAAAATKPFGFQAFYPGPGLGGHCLPIDPFYLSWRARQRYGFTTQFIEVAGRINEGMPAHVVARTRDALSQEGRELAGARILLAGIAYKPDVGDTRESPGLRLISLFEAAGARVHYHDPYVPLLPATRDHPDLEGRRSVPLDEQQVRSADAVVIVTHHGALDYGLIGKQARLVVDTRNAMSQIREPRARIVPA